MNPTQKQFSLNRAASGKQFPISFPISQIGVKLLAAIVLSLIGVTPTQGQGTITLDYPWFENGISGPSLFYDANGMSFRIGPYPPAQPHDNMARVGVGTPSHPNNGTPHMEFANTLGTFQFVVFARTNAASLGQSFLNGAPFGLVSVDLADPVAPSLSPVSITFNGFRADGSMVSQTFITPGSGSSFQTYLFGVDFVSGLTRVEMPSSSWAMDNLVFVPEPGTYALLGLGLLFLGWRLRKL